MRDLCVIAAAAMLLASCGSARRAAGTVSVQSGETSSVDSRTAGLSASAADTIRSYTETEEEFFSIREEFDTARPAYSATGTPPLKSRETVKGKVRKVESSVASSVTAAALEGSSVAAGLAAARDSSFVPDAGRREEGTRKGSTGRHILLGAALTLAAELAALVVVRAFKGRLNGIWKLIKGFFKG